MTEDRPYLVMAVLVSAPGIITDIVSAGTGARKFGAGRVVGLGGTSVVKRKDPILRSERKFQHKILGNFSVSSRGT